MVVFGEVIRVVYDAGEDGLFWPCRRGYLALNRSAVETSSCADTYFARFHTISSVRPAGVRGFVNFISSAVMDVTMRR